MALARRNNTFSSLPSLFDRFFNEGLMDWNNLNYSTTDTTIPAVNVKEDENKYSIEVAAPGMKKDDFDVKLENDMLTISSERKEEKDDSDEGFTRKEFSYQSFQRSFTLPEGHILTDKISAKYNDGILHIELPKRDEVKPQPAKTIKIS
jgi:HSP20 family protein